MQDDFVHLPSLATRSYVEGTNVALHPKRNQISTRPHRSEHASKSLINSTSGAAPRAECGARCPVKTQGHRALFLVFMLHVGKLYVGIISYAGISFFLAANCAVQYAGFRRRGTRKGGVDVIDSALLHSLPHLRSAGRVSYAACRRTRMCSRPQGSILRLDLVSGNEEKKNRSTRVGY